LGTGLYARALLVALGAVLLTACTAERQTARHASLFWQTLQDTVGLVRGAELGEPIKAARIREEAEAQHADSLGLSYRYTLQEQLSLNVDYWKAGQDTGRIAAIVINLHLGSERKARDLLQAFRSYYTRKLGQTPRGTFGQYVWRLEQRNRYVELKFENFKKDLTLNFSYLEQSYEDLYP
jgi:hypothetical protein